jgi:hypothetical protein
MIEFKFDPAQVKQVDINDVKPNDYNPKERESAKQHNIKRGLEQKGLLMPIFVRESKDGFVIVDGEQRWTSLTQAGNDKALIYNLGKLSDKEAKEMTLWFEEQVPFDRVLQAELVKSMTEMYENLELPYLDDEVQNMIKILDYDPNALLDEEFDEPNDDDFDKLVIKMTKDQMEVIKSVIDFVKEKLDCSDGRALEFICVEFKDSPEGTTGMDQD